MFPPLLMFSPVRFVCTKPFPFILVAGPAPYSQDSHGNMQMQLFLTLAVNPSSLYASESNPRATGNRLGVGGSSRSLVWRIQNFPHFVTSNATESPQHRTLPRQLAVGSGTRLRASTRQ